MRAETALWCALLVVLAAALPVAALGTAGGGGAFDAADARAVGQSTASPPPSTATPDGANGTPDGANGTPTSPDQRTVHYDVQLLVTGDADWTVKTYVPLDDESEREAFRDLGRRYVEGTADVDVTADRFRRYVAAASATSGREMEIPDASVERNWTVENGTGVLVLEFTWTNFAREEGDRLVVDDAFRSESGTWLPELPDGQVLVIRPPEGGSFVDTGDKGVSDNRLRWEGPREFGPDYFRIVYRADAGTTPGSPTTTSPSTSPGSGTPEGPIVGMGPVLIGLLAVGSVLGYLVLRRRPDLGDTPVPAGTDDDGGPPATGTAAAGGADAGSGPADTEAGSADDATPEPSPEDPFAGIDVEMLSDEERVVRLLEANGGRMKQAQIVKETDWSNAKVSQLLSGMADDGEIDKLRIGRENLISLPDVEVDQFQE